MNNHLNSQNSVERRYSYKIMDQQMNICLYSIDPKLMEKKKFELLSKLVEDLFKHKGKQGCFITISNLIISALISSEENAPLDIYNVGNDSNEEMNHECRNVLERELFKLSNDLPN